MDKPKLSKTQERLIEAMVVGGPFPKHAKFSSISRLVDVGLLEYRQGETPAFVVTEKAKELYGQERT